MNQTPQVYICYAREDLERVKELREYLMAHDFSVWVNDLDIHVGQVVHTMVSRAIEKADFFVVCLSNAFLRAMRGQAQKEINQALRASEGFLEDDIYFIPVMLENCQPPEALAIYQAVDVSRDDGLERLLAGLKAGWVLRREEGPGEIADPGDEVRTYAQIEEESLLELCASYSNHLAGKHEKSARHNLEAVFLLFKLCYMKEKNLTELSIDPVSLGDYIKETVNDPTLRVLLSTLVESSNLIGRDLNEMENRKRSSLAKILLLAVYFHLGHHRLGSRGVNFIQLRKALTFNQATVSAPAPRSPLSFAQYREIFVREGARDLLRQKKKVAFHSNAVDTLKSLEYWKRQVMSLAIFSLRTGIDIPFFTRQDHAESLPVVEFSLPRMASVFLVSLADANIALYIGAFLSFDEFKSRYKLLTDLEHFVEVLDVGDDAEPGEFIEVIDFNSPKATEEIRRNVAEQGDDQVSPEAKEAAQGAIEDETLGRFRQENRERTGFSQSNIALIEDDNDLMLALSYPMDTWRLFLHPMQSAIARSAEKLIFVQGGPGTGKTVVLAHRIAHFSKIRYKENVRARLLFLSFTRSVSENMQNMVEKLNVDMYHNILIMDIWSFIENRTKGLSGIEVKDGHLVYWQREAGQREEYAVTDLFFDEFQDFPTSNQDSFLVKLMRQAYLTKVNITCTFDEHQSIYHSETDLKFWDKIFPIKHFTLTYCYRMARELSEITYQHRRIMLEHARDMITASTREEISYTSGRAEPVYAFSGGSLLLLPVPATQQLNVAVALGGALRNKYKGGDVLGIFFESSAQKGWGREELEGYQMGLRKKLGLKVMNPGAAKGLEFKAGFTLYSHHRFARYYRYLKEGVSLKQLEIFCGLAAGLGQKFEQAIYEKTELDRHEITDGFVMFFARKPGQGLRFETPAVEEVFQHFRLRGMSPDEIETAHFLFSRWIDNGLNKFLKTYDQAARYDDRELLLEEFRRHLEHNTVRIRSLIQSKRTRLVARDLDNSLLDLNEFYVAITRFRESVCLIYDHQYNLADVLPGAVEIKDAHLGFNEELLRLI